MFKEKYKRDNEMINPSQEFLDKLKAEMKKEESLRKEENLQMRREKSLQKTHKTNGSRKMLTTAAAIAVIVTGAFSYNKFSNTQKNTIMQQTEISQNSGSAESDGSIEDSKNSSNSSKSESSGDIQDGGNVKKGNEKNDLFSNSSWYDSGMSSEEIYSTFVKRISSQDDLKELNVSSTNDFTNGKAMDESSVKKLADSLKNGKLINEDTINEEKNKDDSSSKENPKYYMASFNNGDIIKFVIYDGRYFECSDFKGRFLISG